MEREGKGRDERRGREEREENELDKDKGYVRERETEPMRGTQADGEIESDTLRNREKEAAIRGGDRSGSTLLGWG